MVAVRFLLVYAAPLVFGLLSAAVLQRPMYVHPLLWLVPITVATVLHLVGQGDWLGVTSDDEAAQHHLLTQYLKCYGFVLAGGILGYLALGDAPLAGWFAFFGGVAAFIVVRWDGGGRPDGEPALEMRHYRGIELTEYETAVERSKATRLPTDRGIHFGGLQLPLRRATEHFLIAGTTGSGKSVTFRLMMQDILPRLGRDTGTRALLYDHKGEYLPLLQQIVPTMPILNMNPRTVGGYAWDIARDAQSDGAADALAEILAPSRAAVGGSDHYFQEASRDILANTIKALNRLEGVEWTFRDLICALRDMKKLRKLLMRHPDTAHTEHYFEPESTFRNTISTVTATVRHYAPVAALWSKAERSISIGEWFRQQNPSVLLLGYDSRLAPATRAINQAIFHEFCDLVHAQPNLPDEQQLPQTWVFLDELAEIGRLPKLAQLLAEGRSKGACVVVGFQGIEGIRKAYDAEFADEVTNLCRRKALFNFDGPRSAEWASSVIGKAEVIEFPVTQGITQSREVSLSYSQGEHRATLDAVLPSELMTHNLQWNISEGIRGIYLLGSLGTYQLWLPKEYLSEVLTQPPAGWVRQVHPGQAETLATWSKDDIERLKLTDDDTPADTDPGADNHCDDLLEDL